MLSARPTSIPPTSLLLLVALLTAVGTIEISAAEGEEPAFLDADTAERDAQDLLQVLDSIEGRINDSWDRVGVPSRLVIAIGAIAAENGWGIDGCVEAFQATGAASPEIKQALITAAFRDCKAMCPAGELRSELFPSLGAASPEHKILVLLSACDLEGPDPVFGGDLSHLREQFTVNDYWIQRAAFVVVGDRLRRFPDREQADAIAARFDALVPPLAELLVEQATRPSWDSGHPIKDPSQVTAIEPVLDEMIVLGALDIRVVQDVIYQPLAHLEKCYIPYKYKDRELSGKVRFKIWISNHGAVDRAEVDWSSLEHPGVQKCMCGIFEKLEFPKPEGDGIVIVRYPVEFH